MKTLQLQVSILKFLHGFLVKRDAKESDQHVSMASKAFPQELGMERRRNLSKVEQFPEVPCPHCTSGV